MKGSVFADLLQDSVLKSPLLVLLTGTLAVGCVHHAPHSAHPVHPASPSQRAAVERVLKEGVEIDELVATEAPEKGSYYLVSARPNDDFAAWLYIEQTDTAHPVTYDAAVITAPGTERKKVDTTDPALRAAVLWFKE